MADHRHALCTAGPVVAGLVVTGRKRPTVRLRAGQGVVIVGRVADTRDHGSPFGQRCLHAELVVVAVKIVDALRDDLAFEILPGAVTDTVACVDRLCVAGRLGAEIGTPCLAARTGSFRQCLALAIRTFQATKIGALAEPGAGDEEGHVGRLRCRLLRPTGRRAQRHENNRCNYRGALHFGHRRPPCYPLILPIAWLNPLCSTSLSLEYASSSAPAAFHCCACS